MRKLFIALFIAVISIGILGIGGVGVALGFENQDSFCTSCHTEPEQTYFQRATQAKASDLASYHTKQKTNCIDCHSGAGILGRADGLKQGAHDFLNYVRGKYHSPAVTMNPLGDAVCAKCHTKIFERLQNAGKAGTNHYHFYLPQWKQADARAPSCIACHAPHTVGLEGLKFIQQGKVGKLCEDCHDALSGVVK